MPNGEGELRLAGGVYYKGQFLGGKKHGDGVLTWAEGGKYIGEFCGDEYEGFGQFTKEDGSRYVGQFRGGKMHGIGELTMGNGYKVKGRFSDNQFVGKNSEPGIEKEQYFDSEDEDIGEFIEEFLTQNQEVLGNSFDCAFTIKLLGSFKPGELKEAKVGRKFTDEKLEKSPNDNPEETSDNPENQSKLSKSNPEPYTQDQTQTISNSKHFNLASYDNDTNEWTFNDGTQYYGDMQDSLYQGQGRLITPDGDIYSGHFHAGHYSGQGT